MPWSTEQQAVRKGGGDNFKRWFSRIMGRKKGRLCCEYGSGLFSFSRCPRYFTHLSSLLYALVLRVWQTRMTQQIFRKTFTRRRNIIPVLLFGESAVYYYTLVWGHYYHTEHEQVSSDGIFTPCHYDFIYTSSLWTTLTSGRSLSSRKQ